MPPSGSGGLGGEATTFPRNKRPTWRRARQGAEETRGVARLPKLAKEADRIILAPDDDREGETIAWHIARALSLKGKPERCSRGEGNALQAARLVCALAAAREGKAILFHSFRTGLLRDAPPSLSDWRLQFPLRGTAPSSAPPLPPATFCLLTPLGAMTASPPGSDLVRAQVPRLSERPAEQSLLHHRQGRGPAQRVRSAAR